MNEAATTNPKASVAPQLVGHERSEAQAPRHVPTAGTERAPRPAVRRRHAGTIGAAQQKLRAGWSAGATDTAEPTPSPAVAPDGAPSSTSALVQPEAEVVFESDSSVSQTEGTEVMTVTTSTKRLGVPATGAKLPSWLDDLKIGRQKGAGLMGNGAKIGLVGVLALIVLVVALWDRTNEERPADLGPLPVSSELAESPRVLHTLPPRPSDSVRGEIDATGPLATGAALAGVDSNRPVGTGFAAPVAPAVTGGVDVGARVVAPATPAPVSQNAPTTRSGERRYTIQPGDSLTKISKRFYGNGKLYYRIVKANRDVLPNPDVLPLGVTIVIPAKDAPVASASPVRSRTPPSASRAGSAKTYVVKKGETLYQIAKKTLGKGSRYPEIFRANRDKLATPDAVKAGMTLQIP
jgi:LysM repeat protein